MSSITAHVANGLVSNSPAMPQHAHPGDDLHDLTSAITPVSGPSHMYYPPFPEHNLSMPTMNYQYSMPGGPMDVTYLLAAASANMTLSHDLLMEGHLQARLSGLQDGHASGMSPASVPLTQLSPLPPHQSPVQSSAQSPTTTSFPVAMTSRHTMLSPTVLPDPNDRISKFGAEPCTLTKVNPDVCPDPYAAAFLRERLGDEKWNVFAARLFERRLGITKPSSKNKKELSDVDPKSGGGAGAIDFMVKVEVVKEVLRAYVPHPYNPLKFLKHQYAPAPTGEVTLTRSTVLALSGWSNTQFSYWARRVEAVSVLTPHDERLRTLGHILQQRLQGNIAAESVSAHSDPADEEKSETPGLSNSTSASTSASASRSPSCFERDFGYVQCMTGKGLDIIINEAKKRTGASQFLRGKHSSLDPFGAIYEEDENGAEVSVPVFTPTFQAVEYSLSPSNVGLHEKSKSRAKTRHKTHVEPGLDVGSGNRPQATLRINPAVPHLSFIVSDSRGRSAPPPHTRQESTPSTFAAVRMDTNAMSRSHRTVAITSAQQNAQTRGRDHKHISKEAEHLSNRRELFPVSDSRTELENMPQIYKRGGEAMESFPKKRTKQSDLVQ